MPSPILPGNAPVTEGDLNAHITHRIDDEHLRIAAGRHAFDISLIDQPHGRPLAAIILLDSETGDRLHALGEFWTTLQRPDYVPDDPITPQRRLRLRLMLRVVDGRHTGAPYRVIAEAVFPRHDISPASWVGNSVRETTIRLARDGMKLVDGGYRALLRRPRRP